MDLQPINPFHIIETLKARVIQLEQENDTLEQENVRLQGEVDRLEAEAEE